MWSSWVTKLTGRRVITKIYRNISIFSSKLTACTIITLKLIIADDASMILMSVFSSSNAFDNKLAVAILRIAEGLDCSSITNEEDVNGIDDHGGFAQSNYNLAGNTLLHADSNLSISTQISRVQSLPIIGKNYFIILLLN